MNHNIYYQTLVHFIPPDYSMTLARTDGVQKVYYDYGYLETQKKKAQQTSQCHAARVLGATQYLLPRWPGWSSGPGSAGGIRR